MHCRYSTMLAILFTPVVAMLAAIGCSTVGPLTDESPDLDRHIVAQFGSEFQLTAAELKDRIFHSAMVPTGGIVDDTTIALFLDSLLIDTIAGLEATQFDFDSVWLQARSHRDENHALLVREWWEYSVYSQISADSLEIVQFWKDHPDEFFIPEQIDVYHILCSPDGFLQGADSSIAQGLSREERMVLAEDLCRKLHRMLEFGEAFQNVAFVYSHDIETRQLGGRIGWTVRETYFEPFDSIAFGLDINQYSEPYKDADGWHIIYKEGHLAAGPVPFDSAGVYDAAEQALKSLKANRLLARVADSLVRNVGYNIVYNEEVLNANVHSFHDSVWAATVNERDTIDMRALKPLERKYREKYYVDSTFDDVRREMIHEAADRLMLVQAARSVGLHEGPDYVANEKLRRRTKSKSLILAERFGTPWTPSMDSLESYYNTNIGEFVPTSHLDVELLTIQDSALADFLREQAEVGHELADLGEFWSQDMEMDVAYQDLGIIDSGAVADPIFKAANITRRNRISHVVKTEAGFHFLKVKNRKESMAFINVVPLIREKLERFHKRQQWENFRDSLYALYGVEMPRQLTAMKVPPRSERN